MAGKDGVNGGFGDLPIDEFPIRYKLDSGFGWGFIIKKDRWNVWLVPGTTNEKDAMSYTKDSQVKVPKKAIHGVAYGFGPFKKYHKPPQDVKSLKEYETVVSKDGKTAKSGKKVGPRDPRLPKIGSTLEREYKGKGYVLSVDSDGFRFVKSQCEGAAPGGVFESLTGAAKALTGWPIVNGFRFWGLGVGKSPRVTVFCHNCGKGERACKCKKSERAMANSAAKKKYESAVGRTAGGTV